MTMMPNGHDVKIGDVWHYDCDSQPDKSGTFLVISFGEKILGPDEDLEPIVTAWHLTLQKKIDFAFKGRRTYYTLISRVSP